MRLSALRRAGVLGLNRRNARYLLPANDRARYPLVDDKLATKRLCSEAGIPVPRLYAVAREHHEVRDLPERLAGRGSFVLKPARGAMGNGIVVVAGREGEGFLRSGGRALGVDEFRYHAAGIISGLYSLAGHLDAAMVEQRLEVHPLLAELAEGGVPDVRVIVFRGVPVMAMTRLPTRRSSGRANLHQGALGAGIDLATGRIHHAVLGRSPATTHPDTGRRVVGAAIPAFERVLQIAVGATDRTGLGYVGADVVIDPELGPVILELNARPGLAIQLANRAGLRPRLEAVERLGDVELPLEERVRIGRELAALCGSDGAA